MAEIFDLNILDANNTGRWPDGMSVQSVNDSGRAMEGMHARHYRDTSYISISAGTGAAYTLTPNRAVAAYQSGLVFDFLAHIANTGAATLKIGALAAKPLVRDSGSALVVGDIVQHQPVRAVYVAASDHFRCLGIRA